MYKIMKKGFLLLLLGTMFTFVGCTNETANANATSEETTNDGQEESVDSEANEEGYIIEYSEDGRIKYVREQDRTLLEKHFLFMDGTLDYYEVYQCDENGVYTGRTVYNRDGEVTNVNTFEHDENGNTVKYYVYNPDMVLEQIGTYVKDENQNNIGIIYTTPDGAKIEEQVWNEKGKTILSHFYNMDGDIIATIGYEYDDKNRVSKEISYDGWKCEVIDSYYEYKYDAHNNKTECKTYYFSYTTGEFLYQGRTTYEYDEFERKIRQNNYSKTTDELTSYRITEYLDGARIETNYDADGTKGSWQEYYFDENGNNIGSIWYNADGSIFINDMPENN